MPSDAADARRRELEQEIIIRDERIKQTYLNLYSRILTEQQALIDKIDALQSKGEPITQAQIYKLEQYKRLKNATIEELGRFGTYTQTELIGAENLGIELGTENALDTYIQAIGDNELLATLYQPIGADVIRGVLSYTDQNSPLMNRFENLGLGTWDKVSDTIIQSVALGRNPRVLAQELTKQYGIPLTESMSNSRTLQSYSYRDATRVNYASNSDVIDGWIWHSALQPGRTCMSCVNQHGRKFPLTETLNDHYNGLCVMLPSVKGLPNPTNEIGTEWFMAQPETIQKEMFRSQATFDAWKDGKINLTDMSTTHKDDVYNAMKTQSSLKSIEQGRQDIALQNY